MRPAKQRKQRGVARKGDSKEAREDVHKEGRLSVVGEVQCGHRWLGGVSLRSEKAVDAKVLPRAEKVLPRHIFDANNAALYMYIYRVHVHLPRIC